MAKNRGALRIGIVADSAFFATLSVQNEISFSGSPSPEFSAFGHSAVPMELSVVAVCQPVSTRFDSAGVFTAFDEIFWNFDMSAQIPTDCVLIPNYNHSQTPVKYSRLDDLVLSYASNRLTAVTRESGDNLQLEYDGSGQLIRVTDFYLKTVKNFTYNGSDLESVVVSKLA